jgi:ABC-type Na+ efflux pump permease subunit
MAALSPRTKKLIIFGGIAVALIIALIIGYSTVNSARGGAIERENRIVAQYGDNKNELSRNILTINETLGIADRQSEKLNDILSDAIQGRYDGAMEPGTGGSMFSAIAEAYPDLTATTEMYSKVQDEVISNRASFKNYQSKLIDMVAEYKTWTTADLFRSFVLDTFVGGTPTDLMVIEEGGETYTGQAALDRASRIITTPEVEDIYDSGTQEPIIKPLDDTEE